MNKNRKIRRLTALFIGISMCLVILTSCRDGSNTEGTNTPTNTGTTDSANSGTEDTSNDQGTTVNPEKSGPPTALVEWVAPPAGARLADEVRIIMGNSAVGILDPFNPASNNQESIQAMTMIYDRLLDISNDRELLPELATSHQTDDWKTFTFTLREDVTFHNGEKFTANDVAWTVQAANDGIGSGAFDLWRNVETVNIVNDYTIQLTLSDVNVDFLFNLTRPMASICNEKAMKDNPEGGAMIGTGAFRVTEFASNDYIDMERNDNWWNKDRMPVTERMHYCYVPEPGARSIMMRNGEYQFCYGIVPEDIPGFQADSNFTVLPNSFNAPQILGFNLTDPLMADKNFRLAVIYALDKDEIALIAAGEWAYGDTESGQIWGLDTEFRNLDIPAYTYDPELAKEYLAASSYNGQEVELATAIITNIRASEAIHSQLADIGIAVKINSMDSPSFAVYTAYGNTQSQMFVQGANMSINAASARNVFTPGGGQNRFNYNNPEVTALFEEATRTPDLDARSAKYYKIQELIVADALGTNILWRTGSLISNANCRGIVLKAENERNDMRGLYYILD